MHAIIKKSPSTGPRIIRDWDNDCVVEEEEKEEAAEDTRDEVRRRQRQQYEHWNLCSTRDFNNIMKMFAEKTIELFIVGGRDSHKKSRDDLAEACIFGWRFD